jgi:NDP-sugar pyrophosphorylase family protein
MKAMIFAAGLGTRLKPLTAKQPKALVKINDKPLLEILIEKLLYSGFQDIIINVHHRPDQIIEFLQSKKHFGINIQISDESNLLLDTGGGLKNAAWFFEGNEPFLVHNVDVISNINLAEVKEFHLQSGSLATLAVRKRNTNRYLLFNHQNRLCGWENVRSGEKFLVKHDSHLEAFAFSGIQWINPEIFSLITEVGSFSLIKLYLRLAAQYKINGFDHSTSFWVDVGTPEKLARIEPEIGKYI